MNHIRMIGNLGRDPELRYTGQGVPVLNFSMAHTERFKDKEPRTHWFRVLLWGKTAERFAASGLHKGQRVMVFGKVLINEWEDKDGARRSETQIHANQLYLLASFDQPEQQESRSDSFFPEE